MWHYIKLVLNSFEVNYFSKKYSFENYANVYIKPVILYFAHI